MDQTNPSNLQCVVVTPERTVLDEAVDFVALPMYDGELGVLAGRAPLIGRLGAGELRTLHGQTTRRYFVDGGFAQIRANVVSILTPKAVRSEEIDVTAVRALMESSRRPGATPAEHEANQSTLAKGRTQLRIAEKSSTTSGH